MQSQRDVPLDCDICTAGMLTLLAAGVSEQTLILSPLLQQFKTSVCLLEICDKHLSLLTFKHRILISFSIQKPVNDNILIVPHYTVRWYITSIPPATLTVLPRPTDLYLYFSAHPSLYLPFSLSTRMTTTHSLRPMRMSLLMERIRRRDSSLRRIMPSMLLYSKRLT